MISNYCWRAVRQYYLTSEEMHVQGSCRIDPRELTRIVGTASTRAEREGQSPEKFPAQRNECLQLRPWPPGCCALAPAASIKTKTKERGRQKPGKFPAQSEDATTACDQKLSHKKTNT